MAHTEKTIASQTLFEGRIIEVRKDKVELENGSRQGALWRFPAGFTN